MWATTGIGFDTFNTNNGFWMIRLPEGEATPINAPSFQARACSTTFSWLPRRAAYRFRGGRRPGRPAPISWMADLTTADAHALTVTNGSEAHPVSHQTARASRSPRKRLDFDLHLVLPIDGSPLQTSS